MSAVEEAVRLRSEQPDRDIEVKLRLAVLHSGNRYPVKRDLVIGSGPEADLVLPGEKAAPRHAALAQVEDGLEINELSGVGLLVNGEAIRAESRILQGGDRITIGGEDLLVTDGTEGVLPGVRSGSASLSIGSDARCDVRLDHPAVSPVHAVVEQRAGSAFIRDHSHGSGLLVDGEPVRTGPLRVGSELGIGPYRLVFDGTGVVARADTGAQLSAIDVSRVIGSRTILEPVDVAIRPRELVAIIGQSGAGKTTLLRMLAGVDRPDSGAVLLGGERIESRRSEVGYVPQDEIVHPELTVEEAVWYAAELRLPGDVARERVAAAVAEAIAELELTEHRKTKVAHLSGGQRRRVGVATELVSRPGILLLDEPTTGLDPGMEQRAMELFSHLAGGGRSVVLTTHATRSLGFCDRLLVLAPDGRACFFGPPQAALEFFGVDEYDQIYAALEGSDSGGWKAAFEARPDRVRERELARLELVNRRPGVRPAKRLAGFGRQVRVLVSRYARVFGRDRKNLALLVGQAPLLGLIAALIFPFGALDSADQARNATNLLFLLTTIAVWLGAISAAREVVRERALVRRETAIGVRPSAYLASKCVLLGGLAVVQVVAMVLAAFVVQPPDVGIGTITALVGCLVLAALTAMTLGLAISSFAATENQATSIIPLTLIPQLLLGGAIVAVSQMSVVMKGVAAAIFSRWFFAGAGTAFDLNGRIADDSAFANISEYGSQFFRVPFSGLALIALLFCSLHLLIAGALIRRRA